MRILDLKQGTEEWLTAREGVITGSEVKRVYGSGVAPKTYRYELIANALAPVRERQTNESMEHGTEYEADAIALYEMDNQITRQVGFVLHDEFEWLGVSPDALVKKGKKYIGAVEVKCPDSKTHIKYHVEDKIPAEYRAQIMQYFLVCETIEWLDFVSYDPRIQTDAQMFVKRITREELKDELDVAMGKLLDFRFRWEGLINKYIF